MPVLIGALLALLVVGVVLYPFVKRRFGAGGPCPSGPADGAGPVAWRLRREEIYESIRSLQLEYEIGGVEEADYRDRLRAYRVQAAAVVREQERAEREVERLVEMEVGALRESGPPGPPRPVTPVEDGTIERSVSQESEEYHAEEHDGPRR